MAKRKRDRWGLGAPPSALNPLILEVAREVSGDLRRRGIAHALIGGLAVGMHGRERATADIDFLLAGAAREVMRGFPLGANVDGVTFTVRGVTVDLLFPKSDEKFLERALKDAVGDLPVVPLDALVYLKMKAARGRDRGDVIELVKAGADVASARKYLIRHLPGKVALFDALVAEALVEPD